MIAFYNRSAYGAPGDCCLLDIAVFVRGCPSKNNKKVAA
jgi:hypothetical protein